MFLFILCMTKYFIFWIKIKKYRIGVVILLTLFFDYLFWDQGWGLNTVIMAIVLVSLLFTLNPLSLIKKNVWFTVAGTLLSAVLVLIYNSIAADIAFVISFTVMVGFFHQSQLRTVHHAFLTAIASILYSPLLFTGFSGGGERGNLRKFFYVVRLCLIPLVVLFTFYWIYKFANPFFNEISSAFWVAVRSYCSVLFSGLSFGHISFVLFLFFLIAAAIFNRDVRRFLEFESAFSEFYLRKKPLLNHKIRRASFGELFKGFRNEYRIACIMLGMLNVLLLLVNIIDINKVWFGFNYSDVLNLAQFVHEGTYLLILSILISMGIILYFFNGNINLLKNKKSLLILSYIWIVQNAIMVFSVAIRNYHYIHQHGIAYKRIGVIVFLILVLVGLVTLVFKINGSKSSFYLFKTNAWAVYIVMIAMACFDWDMIIVQNNVNHPNEAGIDKGFLLSLSDKTLFVLKENRVWFPETGVIDGHGKEVYAEFIDNRISEFIKEYPNRGWQSFNLADYECYENLTQTAH